jgi:hypothetical protein
VLLHLLLRLPIKLSNRQQKLLLPLLLMLQYGCFSTAAAAL